MIKLNGAKGVLRQLRKLQHDYPDAVSTALYQEGLQLDGMMVKDIPVDYGRLRGSHYVTEPTNSRNPVVEVGVGTDYAIYVHERTELRHRVGRAKFLQVNVEKIRPDYLRHILALTRSNIAKGVKVNSIQQRAPVSPATESDEG